MSRENGKGIMVVRLEVDPTNPITVEKLSQWIREASMVQRCCWSKCDECQSSGSWLRQQMESHLRPVKR